MLKTSSATSDATDAISESVSEEPHRGIAAGFHALSDPLRIQVLELLRRQELCVCELCDQLAVNQSKLSFHLKTLKDAGLIRGRQEGRWIYYSLNLSQFVELEQYLAEYHRFSPILPGRQCSE
ncbi:MULTISPECIES: ArsR/SmtB family transcription factor [Planktothricoides]|uniref:Metalloregulator ArsR/SmtB family transcription factor n=2 Tax=Planktothricoides raciborskii TaxID=132608 RepID=A0AAU8J7B8_9CYAN|nr:MULTISPECIES: metalloregulator ArsR/SmtB family transcription factor [Planktothricoides]MBD2546374.1 winged helix-turn-helix transcriptional regulator [Planktothricoides raciborskii FACHB-1370]MBD2584772.1 winged helix-turn-helix transcriptional regulator [Planktothricoides raciborskii FACHB-1261]